MKIAIILHLYYPDLWDWFLPYLKGINVPNDMYITLTENRCPDQLLDKIMVSYPNAVIKVLPNKGLDVAPFLWSMQYIIDNGYEYTSVLKLHGKKSEAHKVGLGTEWRTELVDSLLKDPNKFRHYCNINKDTDTLMSGSEKWLLQQKIRGYEQKFFTRPIPVASYLFVGGTIFLMNFRILKQWLKSEDIYNRFYDQFKEGYIADGSLAHEFERAFGLLVVMNHGKILKC